MLHKRKSLFFGLGLVVLLVMALVAALPAAAQVFIAGNPTCADAGYGSYLQFKIDPPVNGTYAVPGWPGLEVTVTFYQGGELVDWSSNFGIKAVIVKGGPNANVYAYNPWSLGDTGLVSPDHPRPGQIPNISHVTFCYEIAPGIDLTKTASAELVCVGDDVTYTYTITNTGNVPLNVTLVDDNGTPGDTSDDWEVNDIAVAVGGSAEQQQVRAISEDTTNTATAYDQFDNSVSASASASVAVEECGGGDPQWCSPGYWRQPHHLDSWEATGISPNAKYSAYFGLPTRSNQGVRQNAPTDPTLLQVVQNPQWYGGGATNNVGDLLSGAHPDVNYTGERVEDSCPLN